VGVHTKKLCKSEDLYYHIGIQHTMWGLLGRVEMDRRHAEKAGDSNVLLHCVRIILSLSFACCFNNLKLDHVDSNI
jgi:hypothetical protein